LAADFWPDQFGLGFREVITGLVGFRWPKTVTVSGGRSTDTPGKRRIRAKVQRVSDPPGYRTTSRTAVPSGPDSMTVSSASSRMRERPSPDSWSRRSGVSTGGRSGTWSGSNPRPRSATSTSMKFSARLHRIVTLSGILNSSWARMALATASETANRRSAIRSGAMSGSAAATAPTMARTSCRYSAWAGTWISTMSLRMTSLPAGRLQQLGRRGG